MVCIFADAPPTRAAALRPLAERLLGGNTDRWVRSLDLVVPHRTLRRLMVQDVALEALLTVSPVVFAIDPEVSAGFRLGPGPIARLAPALLVEPRPLAVAARVCIELALARNDAERAAAHRFAALLGRHLNDRERVVAGVASFTDTGAGGQLSQPLEDLLVSGGDSRLAVDPLTGMNRYGTSPVPRPEAIQFSSSTASTISDYAFWFADLVRSTCLQRLYDGDEDELATRDRLADQLQAEIRRLLRLAEDEAEVILCASGTDSEALAVLLGLGATDRPLTNILIAPEESGRGVSSAGAGRYFDHWSQTGNRVDKGEPIWPHRRITAEAVSIRDHQGKERSADDVAAEVSKLVDRALSDENHVIVHQLLSSKTGLILPDRACLERIKAVAPERIDIVVDSCQVRTPLERLGELVRHGWMVQISGSKSFTGPPFSGALIVPTTMRNRRDRVAVLLQRSADATDRSDWPQHWRSALPPAERCPSFGPLFRWMAALVEVTLLEALPVDGCWIAYDRFRSALDARIRASERLVPLADRSDDPAGEDATALDFSSRSIISFAVADPTDSRCKDEATLLSFDDCQLLFEMLNRDLSDHCKSASARERALLAVPAHIGQPVALRSDAYSVLRLVIGARFFTIVGFGPRGSENVALLGEIADAVRAIDKLELLLQYWSDLRPANIHDR